MKINLDDVEKNSLKKEGYKKTFEAENNSIFEFLFKDEDDGCDDGKISFKEGAKNFGKGFFSIVDNTICHPLKTAASVGVGVTLSCATGKAILPVMIAGGAAIGTGQIAHGIYKVVKAKDDKTARRAYQKMGLGTFALASSTLAAKKALICAAEGGVKSAAGVACKNPFKNTVNCIKVSKDSLLQSGTNIKGNFLTLTTGNIHANSNVLRKNQVKYMSKANEAKSYRFNPNGTDEEILANNPGVFKGEDGKFYVNNKWDAKHPFAIDPTKEQMIMIYDADDMAVCAGDVFEGSYVDSLTFKGKGELNYQKPSSLEYGKVIDVTKQAKGAFKKVPVGTKVQTLEGITEVQEGQVIAVDHAGNPYVTPVSNILKRNVPLKGYEEAFKSLECA